jgi:hypothetical protein
VHDTRIISDDSRLNNAPNDIPFSRHPSALSAYDRWIVKPVQRQESHRNDDRHGDDEHYEALVGLPAIALDEGEASRFLKALEQPDDRTIARLTELRHRAR